MNWEDRVYCFHLSTRTDPCSGSFGKAPRVWSALSAYLSFDYSCQLVFSLVQLSILIIAEGVLFPSTKTREKLFCKETAFWICIFF